MSAQKAIEQYYRLKGQYQARLNRLKRRILKSDGTMAEKRQELESNDLPCIHCKRSVGTRFYSDGGFLIARCGDYEDPCTLNIRIKRGIYRYSPTLLHTIHHDTEVAKMNIIKEKLDLLFGLNDEETLARNFEVLKRTYKDLVRYTNLVEKDMQKGSELEVEAPGLVRSIQRTELARINQIRLGNAIRQFKELIVAFRDGKKRRTRGRSSKLKDAIELYQTQIIPTIAIIRRALYDINAVVQEKKEFRLIQIKTSLENLVIQMEAPEIIHNIK